jgi:Flp pilus assembly protein TadD
MGAHAREGAAESGHRSTHRGPHSRLAGAGMALSFALLGGCPAAPPPSGPLMLGGPLLDPAPTPDWAKPLLTDLPPDQPPAPAAVDRPVQHVRLPILRPPVVPIFPPPAKPQPPDDAPRVAWVPQPKPGYAAGPPPIWPPPRKPSPASDWAAWAPAAGPPAASEAPAHRPDREAVAVAHGLATRADADHAVRVGDRDQQLDNLDQAAREALLAGDAATALSLYERLTREFPEARAARLGQALALEQLGRSDEARVMYQALLQLDPGDLGTKIALLGILAERAPDEALQLLRRLARHHPDDPRLAAQIAMVLARTGDLAAAIVAGRRAVALDPGHAGYRANLAILLDRAGQRSAAIEQYQRVLELATLGGAPTARLGAIAARLHHLRQAPPPPPAEPSR